MGNQVRTLTVVLEPDSTEYGVERSIAAIRMIKCVESVEVGYVEDLGDFLARQRVYSKMREQLLVALEGMKNDE